MITLMMLAGTALLAGFIGGFVGCFVLLLIFFKEIKRP